MPIFPDPSLSFAKPLVAVRRKKPAIVILNKYNMSSNRENFCFHITFLSGCWRSDQKIKANCNTYEEAAKYHGVFSGLDESESDQFYRKLLTYMIQSNRFSPFEIARNIAIIEPSVNTLCVDQILCDFENINPVRIMQI